MRLSKFFVGFLLVLLCGSCFSVFLLGSGQVDSSVLSMSGNGWSVKVDSSLQSSLDSKAVPFTMVSKAGVEKELFLTLNSLKDCVAGQIEFKVQAQGLSVYKQLPLDKELNLSEYDFVNATVAMKKDRVVMSRPENVVNSFACFDESGKKVLHIYASKLIDAKGSEIWVDSDLKDGSLTVYLDQKWLDGAVFPVVVDPTFGYTSIGASYGGWGGVFYASHNSTLTGANTVSAIKLYTHEADNFKVGIYKDTAGVVDTLSYGSNSEACSADAWHIFTLSQSLVAGNYWLCWISENGAGAAVAYDSALIGYKNDGASFASFPDPFSSTGTTTFKWSIYAEYDVTPTPTPSPSPSPSPTASSGSYVFVLGEADWVLVLEVVMLVSCFVSLLWFGKIPILPLMVGLFAFLISLYCGLSGLWDNVVIGYFGGFVALFGGLTMLLVGLGVRVRR